MSKALLQTLTPVHVGSGKSYKHKIEFFSENKNIYIIDPEKIFQKIGTEGINEWVRAIEKDIPIRDFLKNRKLLIKPEEIALRKCMLFNEIKKDKELHEQIYNPLLGPYIPGSSIKGAIKTTILSYISLNEKIINNIKLNDIKKINERGKTEWSDKKVDAILFGEDANHKSTRFLKIGDAYFTNTETIVYFTQALNADNKGWKINGNISNLYEAVPEGAKTLFELKFDDLLFKRNIETEEDKWSKPQFEFLKKDITSLIKLLNKETIKALNKEIEFFKEINLDDAGQTLINKYQDLLEIANKCNGKEFILRIGANSGYNFTTFRWIDQLQFFQPLEKNKEYASLRSEIQKNRHRKDYRGEQLWPRTRKVITSGIPFGFIKITLLSDEEYKKELEQVQKQPDKQKYETIVLKSDTEPVKKTEPSAAAARKTEPPKPYTGKLFQGAGKIPAMVIKSGRPNIVKLLITDNEIELPLQGYASEIETGKYIYVRISQFSKGKIGQVNYEREIM